MERLGGLDAAFLYVETPTVHMHVVGLLVLDPTDAPAPVDFAAVRRLVEARLPRIPALRRRLASVPLNLGRPSWVDDANFDLDHHLRRTVVPAPGDDRRLAAVASDIAGRPLERARPLWEMWVVEGLAGGRLAVVAKMHHATIDGVTGANLISQLFDLAPDAPDAAGAHPWVPQPAPGDLALAGRALLELGSRPLRAGALVPRTAAGVGRLLWHRARPGTVGMPAPFTAPRTSFNATLTARRAVAFTEVDLADVKAVKNAFGVTVNDVVTAVCAGALRRYLSDRGELPERSLVAAVPVSVHAEAADRPGATKVSFLFSRLPTELADPAARLRAAAATNAGAKREHRLVGATLLQDWAEHAAPNTFSLAARVYSGLRVAERHPVVHNLILSNVPGPPVPLYLGGARLAGMYPLGPLTDGAGLNVTVLSHTDRVGFGVIACRDLVDDLWALAEAVPPALAELVAAAPDPAG